MQFITCDSMTSVVGDGTMSRGGDSRVLDLSSIGSSDGAGVGDRFIHDAQTSEEKVLPLGDGGLITTSLGA